MTLAVFGPDFDPDHVGLSQEVAGPPAAQFPLAGQLLELIDRNATVVA